MHWRCLRREAVNAIQRKLCGPLTAEHHRALGFAILTLAAANVFVRFEREVITEWTKRSTRGAGRKWLTPAGGPRPRLLRLFTDLSTAI